MENKKNYIDNEEFKAELDKWKASSEKPEDRQPSERLGQMLMLLHDRILLHSNFRRYNQDLKEEMKSWSLFRILKRGLFTYNFKTSPFSYFTRAIFLNYMAVLKKYYTKLNKHQEYVKHELMKIDTKGDPKLERLLREYRVSLGNDQTLEDK